VSAAEVLLKPSEDDMKTRNTPAKSIATDETIEQLLWDCLDEIPFIEHKQVEQRIFAHPGRPEIVAKLRIGGQDRTLVAEVKANGQPRLVREAIGEILQYRQNYPNAYGVVIAPVLSAHAMKICRQEGIGYLDLAGNCLLNLEFIYINKNGRLTAKNGRKNFRSWYSPRVERILRSLYLHPNRTWKIRELAMEAFVSPNQALSLKNHLSGLQWLEEDKQGFRLARPDLLLDEWAENYLANRSVERVFTSPRSVLEIEAALAHVCQEQIIPYALMGFSAAMRFDPLLRYERVSAYVVSDLSKVIAALDLSETSSKGNVSLWVPYDDSVLRGAEQFDHAKVTAHHQTYLDLIGLEGRGEKAANNLWQHFMKDKWFPQSAAA
jgi:hypothetical protein